MPVASMNGKGVQVVLFISAIHQICIRFVSGFIVIKEAVSIEILCNSFIFLRQN